MPDTEFIEHRTFSELSEEEISKLVIAYESQLSLKQISARFGIPDSTLYDWYRKWISAGIVKKRTYDPVAQTINATDASKRFSRARRIRINDKALEVAERWLDRALDDNCNFKSHEFRDIMVGYGIAEEKRQLLEPLTQTDSVGKAAILAFVEMERAKPIESHEIRVPEPETT